MEPLKQSISLITAQKHKCTTVFTDLDETASYFMETTFSGFPSNVVPDEQMALVVAKVTSNSGYLYRAPSPSEVTGSKHRLQDQLRQEILYWDSLQSLAAWQLLLACLVLQLTLAVLLTDDAPGS